MMKKINAFFMMSFVTGCHAMGTKDHEAYFALPNINKSPTLSRSHKEAVEEAILLQKIAITQRYQEVDKVAALVHKEHERHEREETWCTLF